MKRFLLGSVAVCVALMFTGCAVTKISQPSAPINAEVYTQLTPELAVGEKIQGEANMSVLFGIFAWGTDKYAEGVSYGGAPEGASIFGPSPEAKAKSAAVYNAVTANKTDVIVSPAYIIDIDDYVVFKKIKANVTGFSGKVSSIK